MKVKVKDVYNFLDKIAPFSTSMDFDNCGLLVGHMDETLDKVLLSLDITSEVIREAKEIGANLIISHHPIIFKPVKRIKFGSVLDFLITSRINAICAHTNLDMAENCGVNCCLAKELGLENLKPLSVYKEIFFDKISVFVPKGYEDKVIDAMCKCRKAGKIGNYSNCSFLSEGEGRFCPESSAKPFLGEADKIEKVDEIKVEVVCPRENTSDVLNQMKEVHPYETPAYEIFENKALKKEISCGFLGELKEAMECRDFANLVKNNLKCKGIRYTETGKKLKKIAVCSGAGGDYLSFAIKKGADAFVTGEIKHSLIIDANENNLCVVDASHFRTEDVVFSTLKEQLKKEFPALEFFKSKTFTDAMEYL